MPAKNDNAVCLKYRVALFAGKLRSHKSTTSTGSATPLELSFIASKPAPTENQVPALSSRRLSAASSSGELLPINCSIKAKGAGRFKCSGRISSPLLTSKAK